MTRILYDERFERGPGPWRVGIDDPAGPWHRNLFGQRGCPAPAGWQGGDTPHACSQSPWYFDDNHGELFWLHLAFFLNRSADAGLGGADLRDTEIDLTLRAPSLDARGTRLFFWMQGSRAGEASLYNWCLYTRPIDLAGDDWTAHTLRLAPDETQWRAMGLLNGGLARKLRIVQSVSSADGSLADILGGGHINCGFVLGEVDPADPPTGRIDFSRVTIRAGR